MRDEIKNIIIIILSIMFILELSIGIYLINYIINPPSRPFLVLEGELKVICINQTNNSITFELILTKPSKGITDKNLHSENVNNRRYKLILLNESNENNNTTVIDYIDCPKHIYVDHQNDYKINTGDLIIIFNRSKYIGYKVLFMVEPYEGLIYGEII